jgi:hypothetical protein
MAGIHIRREFRPHTLDRSGNIFPRWLTMPREIAKVFHDFLSEGR